MPIVDSRSQTLLKAYDIFNTTEVFNPGSKAPWNGFANAINIESELKNQIFPIGNIDRNYIPSSTSDLYRYPGYTYNSILQSSDLNDTPLFNKSIGNIFNNCTRNQMKEMYLK